MPTPPALEVSDLTASYGRREPTLHNVNIALAPGEFVAMLGPNGAGKTTLVRTISGLLSLHDGTVRSGSVALAGKRIDRLRPAARVRIGLAQSMEGRRLFPDLTVEDNLRVGQLTRRLGRSASRTEIDEALEPFAQLVPKRHQLAGSLSGGEQQMVALVRAMLAKPSVLLLDEPSLGLSPQMTAEIGRQLQRIRRSGVAVLLIEQNAAMALALADRAYVLERGRIVLSGTAAELLADASVRESYLGLSGDQRSAYRSQWQQQRDGERSVAPTGATQR